MMTTGSTFLDTWQEVQHFGWW